MKKIRSKYKTFLTVILVLIFFGGNQSNLKGYPSTQQDGIVYKVQISSGRESADKLEVLNSTYSFDYPIEEIYINGRYKYMVGSFSNYADANNYKLEVIEKHGITDAFIAKVPTSQKTNTNTPDPVIEEEYSQEENEDPYYDNYDEEEIADDNEAEEENIESEEVIAESEYIGSAEAYIIVNNIFNESLIAEEIQTENENETDKPSLADTSQSETVTDDTITVEESAYERLTSDSTTHTAATKAKVKKPFPQNLIEPILHVIETTFNSNRIIIIAVILIFYFQMTFILLVIFIVIARFVKSAQDAKKELIRERYQNIIADYLFSDDSENTIPPDLLKIRSNMRSELLVDEVLLLHKNLSGETYERLIKLYFELSLHQYSINKLKRRQWHVVAKGIIELTQMDVTSALKRIEELVDSPNDIIRMEAQLALIRLNKSHPFSFLDSFTEELNEWEKLNIHNLIETHKIEIPRFKKWLSSHNDSVVLFCIQMIHIYKQNDAYESLIGLLDHPNKEINRRAIMALGELGEPGATEQLKNVYGKSYLQNKLRIIAALGQIGDDSNLLFLENLLEDNDFDIRYEAAIAMKNIGGTGMMLLLEKMREGDEELQLIIKHVLDERI